MQYILRADKLSGKYSSETLIFFGERYRAATRKADPPERYSHSSGIYVS